MNFSSLNKPPLYFWIVSGIATLWYAIGAYNYVFQMFMTKEQRDVLSSADQVLYDTLPFWYVSVFALAVATGFVASLSLLIRKRWAYILFILSFLAVGIQQFYILTVINPRDIFISLSALVIAVFLIWFSKRAISKKWLV